MMPILRSHLLLAWIALLMTSGSPGWAVGGQPRPAPPVGSISGITDPKVRQVVQRRDDNNGYILVVGTFEGNADGFQGRSLLRPGMTGIAQDWSPLVDLNIARGFFAGIFRQPAGGFYDLQFRPVFQGRAGSPVTVFAVGVGEVFITAGQSNSTNAGDRTGFKPDLRVSSFNDGPRRGVDPAYPGASWQWGVDPQPAVDLTIGGSAWPKMASNLAAALNVPIGLYTAGCGGTTIREWLPGVVKAPTNATPSLVLFDRLTNALNYFKIRGGVRAVLWDQGENDYDLDTNPVVYEAVLRRVIDQSRASTGVPVKWMVAQAASYFTTEPARRTNLEQAQAHVTDGVHTFLGPDTDLLGAPFRQSPPGGFFKHFNATGLQVLGDFWGIYVFNTPGLLGPGFLPAP